LSCSLRADDLAAAHSALNVSIILSRFDISTNFVSSPAAYLKNSHIKEQDPLASETE
jgi:hypothetical protein